MNWNRWGDLLLAVGSIGQAGLLFWMSQSHHIVVLYLSYIFYRVIYQLTTTIAQSTLAFSLDSRLFGLLFGINTFVALLLQSILTAVVIDWQKLDIRPQVCFEYLKNLRNSFFQFVVYSCYHLVVAFGFAIIFGIWASRRFFKTSTNWFFVNYTIIYLKFGNTIMDEMRKYFDAELIFSNIRTKHMFLMLHFANFVI